MIKVNKQMYPEIGDKMLISWDDYNRPDEHVEEYMEENRIPGNQVLNITDVDTEGHLVWCKEIPEYALSFRDIIIEHKETWTRLYN